MDEIPVTGDRGILNRFARRLTKAASPLFRATYRWYVKKPRTYSYKGIHVLIHPGVFYPRFIFSTRIMLDFLDRIDLRGKKLLEIGAGSGILSVLAAKKGAIVTATDINPAAAADITDNAARNGLEIKVVESDLLLNVPERDFDIIIITPPYYPEEAKTYADMAWFCGRDHEYFRRLFPQMKGFDSSSCLVYMILSEECNIRLISGIARQNDLVLVPVLKRNRLGEMNFIFRMLPVQQSIFPGG